MNNGNALAILAVAFAAGMAFLAAGPAEMLLERSCAQHAPTTEACARW